MKWIRPKATACVATKCAINALKSGDQRQTTDLTTFPCDRSLDPERNPCVPWEFARNRRFRNPKSTETRRGKSDWFNVTVSHSHSHSFCVPWWSVTIQRKQSTKLHSTLSNVNVSVSSTIHFIEIVGPHFYRRIFTRGNDDVKHRMEDDASDRASMADHAVLLRRTRNPLRRIVSVTGRSTHLDFFLRFRQFGLKIQNLRQNSPPANYRLQFHSIATRFDILRMKMSWNYLILHHLYVQVLRNFLANEWIKVCALI